MKKKSTCIISAKAYKMDDYNYIHFIVSNEHYDYTLLAFISLFKILQASNEKEQTRI